MYKCVFAKRFLVLLTSTLFFGVPICHANKTLDIGVTGSIKTAYDDNITYASSHRLSDFVTNLETGLVLMQQGKTHQLSLQMDVIEQIFADHSNFDNTSEDLEFDYKQDFSEYDHMELEDNLRHAYGPASFEEAFGRTTGLYGIINNKTGVSYKHDFSERLSGEMHYDDTLTDFSHSRAVNSILYQGGAPRLTIPWIQLIFLMYRMIISGVFFKMVPVPLSIPLSRGQGAILLPSFTSILAPDRIS